MGKRKWTVATALAFVKKHGNIVKTESNRLVIETGTLGNIGLGACDYLRSEAKYSVSFKSKR